MLKITCTCCLHKASLCNQFAYINFHMEIMISKDFWLILHWLHKKHLVIYDYINIMQTQCQNSYFWVEENVCGSKCQINSEVSTKEHLLMVTLIELEERITWGSIFLETFKISQVRPKSSKSVNFKLTDYTSNTTHSVILRLTHPVSQSISQSVRSPASESASQSGRQSVSQAIQT